MNNGVILLGGGGHASVLLEIIGSSEVDCLGYTALERTATLAAFLDIPYLGTDDDVIAGYSGQRVLLVNGIGFLPKSNVRRNVYEKMRQNGFEFTSVIHDRAIVSAASSIGAGAQVMAGAVVQTGVVIGENTIINTSASVDHDVEIGAHCHVAPGATICGGVVIGESAFIGSGATVIQDVTIGPGSIVGAGATITAEVPAGAIVYPAKTYTHYV